MPGFIAMTAVFVVVGIEMFFASKGAGHSHAVDYDTLGQDGHAHARPGHKRSHSFGRYSSGPNGNVPGIVLHDIDAESSEQSGLMAGRSPALSMVSPSTPTAPNGHAARRSIDSDDDSDLDISPEELARQQEEDDLEDESQLLSHPPRAQTKPRRP
jgi:zinc transporter 1/2/3